MTKVSNIVRPSAFAFTGANHAKRTEALIRIGSLAFAEGASRNAMIVSAKLALGKAPTDIMLTAVQTQFMIGHIASRMVASEFPKACNTPVDRMAFAADLIEVYQERASEKAKLKAGKKGFRSPVQHKAVRAAISAWSLFKAELELPGSSVQTMAEKNKKAATRSTKVNPVRGASKAQAKGAAQTVILAKPAAPISCDDYVQHMATQLSTLASFDAKYAGKRPTTHAKFAEALLALKRLGDECANEYQLRKDKVIAENAAKAK